MKAVFALTVDAREALESVVPPFVKRGEGGGSPRLARTETRSNPPQSPFAKGEATPARANGINPNR
jgi:hypothetical protein